MSKDNFTNEEVRDNYFKSCKYHRVKVEFESNEFRSVLFMKKSGSFAHHYRLTTWPEHLCISGDMGTFVFRRHGSKDMFHFFYDEEDGPLIQPSYWSEKLKAGEHQEFCGWTEFLNYLESQGYITKKQKDWVWSAGSELNSSQAAICLLEEAGIEPNREMVDDVWELEDYAKRYTYQYIWCLWATVYGIKAYRQKKGQLLTEEEDNG